MVKINIELNNGSWFYIETVPFTQKTFSDLKQRIPDSLMWRPTLLSEIVKNPSFSAKTWSEKIPSYIITIILNCIDDILEQYHNEKNELDEVLDTSVISFTDDELLEYIDNRGSLTERILSFEENTREFKYTKEDIEKLREKSMKKPKPLYIGSNQ